MTTRAQIRQAEADLWDLEAYSDDHTPDEAEALAHQLDLVQHLKDRHALRRWVIQKEKDLSALVRRYYDLADEAGIEHLDMGRCRDDDGWGYNETPAMAEMVEPIQALAERLESRKPEIRSLFRCPQCDGRYRLFRRCSYCDGKGVDEWGADMLAKATYVFD